jgi:hypothetical protein
MRNLAWIALGLALLPNPAVAQETGVIGERAIGTTPEYTPLTESEKLRLFIRRAVGPVAIARAAAGGGFAQASGTPKEWRGGAEAYGKRVGNSLATHIVAKSIEYGGSELLREDNRYMRSGETAFGKRLKHVVGSTFIARNEAGREHFAYSRFGGAAGSAFISRIWQPHSTNSSGDAAVTFGITMATDIAGNFLHEFWGGRH